MAKLIALLVQGSLFSAINKVYAKDVRSVRRRTAETVFHGPLLGVSAKELSPEAKSLEYELQELLDQRNNEHSAQEPRNENRKLYGKGKKSKKGQGKGNGGKKGYGKGKGNGGGKKSYGKGKGGKKGGKKGVIADHNWPFDDNWWHDDLFDDGFSDGCKMFLFAEEFIISEPDDVVGDASGVGSTYIFSPESIFDANGDPIEETIVTGTCTRTAEDGGQCTFTFVDETDGFTITATGIVASDSDSSSSSSDSNEITSSGGGKLAITGGTGSLTGIVGSMNLTPIFADDATTNDIFLDINGFSVQANFGIIACRPTVMFDDETEHSYYDKDY